MAVGDVNGDGKPDLVVPHWDSDAVSVLLGTGTGSFWKWTDLVGAVNGSSVAMGDLNGDGSMDLVTTAGGDPEFAAGVSIWLGDRYNVF